MTWSKSANENRNFFLMIMKKTVIFCFFLSWFFLQSAFAVFQQVEDIESARIERVAISELNPELIYASSDNSLYKSIDNGRSFKKTAVFKDENVKHIFFDPYLADILYIATARHLFKTDKYNEKIFSCPDEEVILTAEKHKGVFYLGTTQGAYYASEDVLNWAKLKNLREEAAVYDIEAAGEKIFFAASKGVYVLNNKGSLKRTFVIRNSEADGGLVPAVIKADISNENTLYLGTNRGIYLSIDQGESWNKLYIESINSLSVNSISQTRLEKGALYLSTTKGFFKVRPGTGEGTQIFEGLHSSYINWSDFDSQGEIYLATEGGLFRNAYFTGFQKNSRLEDILGQEPSIEEIQRAALHYNEVHPDKIMKWRNGLKYRALFPSVSLDYDKTVSYDSGSDRYYIGPHDWGVSFSWDVGDLLWNSYEDDVDTRGRLNTQLRLDILDEINRVYFERIRLIKEMSEPSSSDEEEFKNNIRMRELTAILDGYTGGYFSCQRNKLGKDE